MSQSAKTARRRNPKQVRAAFLQSLHARCPSLNIEADQENQVALLCMTLDTVPDALDLVSAHIAACGLEQTFCHLKPLLDNPPRSEASLASGVYGAFHAMLSEPEQIFLSRLALFAGPWTLESASHICLTSCAAAWCETLIKRGLISAYEDAKAVHYSMTQPLRDYLQEAASMEQWAAWKTRFVEHYAAIAEEAVPHLRYTANAEWTFRLEVEKENLYAAIEYASGEQCAALVCNLWRWGFERSEFERMFDMVLIALSEGVALPPHLDVEIHRALGVLSGRRGDRDLGIGYLNYALSLAEEHELKEVIPHLLHHLGVVHRNKKNFSESESMHQKSYRLWCDSGNLQGQMFALNALGIVYWTQQRLDEADAAYAKSAAICSALQDYMMAAKVLLNRAIIAEDRGNYEASLQSFLNSLSLLRKVEAHYDEMICLNNVGVINAKIGNLRQANEYFHKALGISKKYAYEAYITVIIASMGEASVFAKDYNKAIKLFGAYDVYKVNFQDVTNPAVIKKIDEIVEGLRRRVPPRRFTGLWKKGQSLSLDEIIKRFLN